LIAPFTTEGTMPMSSVTPANSRFRSYLRFIAAVIWFFLARSLAHSEAAGLTHEQFAPLVEQAVLAVLLLLGYAAMGFAFDREPHPISAQGLPRRTGWLGEASLGLAVGWALAVACVLPMVVGGGIAIVLVLGHAAWAWLLIEIAFFALAALVEEVAFRGYGFQRLADAVGPLGAALGYAAFYAIVQAMVLGSNRVSVAVSVALSLLLSMAYVRTRALWMSWGINFAWKASRALLFGLAISGVNSHAPVVQGNPMGPFWLTGGGFGLDGSWVAFIALLVALPVVYRVTRELDYKYNAPVIVPAGIPVDLSAAGLSQHEAAMGTTAAAAPSSLVQILPVTAATELPSAEKPPAVG
jgi:membrane protease YdiL (CAAX protease family)